VNRLTLALITSALLGAGGYTYSSINQPESWLGKLLTNQVVREASEAAVQPQVQPQTPVLNFPMIDAPSTILKAIPIHLPGQPQQQPRQTSQAASEALILHNADVKKATPLRK